MSKRGINTGKETRVQQNFKDETNVNNIVKRFQQTGQLPQGRNQEPLYLDHTQFTDYTEMLNQTSHVKQVFDQYPAKIRARFQNQPAQLLEFLSNPENKEEAIAIGLAPRPQKPDAQRSGAPEPKAEDKDKPAPQASKTDDKGSSED